MCRKKVKDSESVGSSAVHFFSRQPLVVLK